MQHYYAAHSYMGMNYTYDSPCWMVYRFTSNEARRDWLQANAYDGRQYVAESVTRKTAAKICGRQSLETPRPHIMRGDVTAHRLTDF